MTTIIIHGTKLIAGAQATPWWYDSWHAGGFLNALASGMTEIAGGHDVWTVGGTPVSDIADFNRSWSMWSGRRGQVSAHNGHFIWSGANMSIARDAGADELAHYLNAVRRLTDEPIRIVAYSHGCNVVKGASASRELSTDVWIEQAVFLAGPHFYAPTAQETVYAYRLDPGRFGRILNLYTERDEVQVGLSDAITGPAGARWMTWVPPEAAHTDPDPRAAHLYENCALDVADDVSGIQAHTVVHGSVAGRIAGMWLGGMPLDRIPGQFGGRLPVLRADDDGQ